MNKIEQINRESRWSILEHNFYKEIMFCSNKLINVPYIIGVGDFAPVVIAKGYKPKISLFMLLPNIYQWIPIVENNKSQSPTILVKKYDKTTQIEAKGTIIIRAETQEDTCLITACDFRPIGLEIYGNDTKLTVGKSYLSENTIANAKFFVGLSEPESFK